MKQTQPPYSIGDYFCEDDKEGVVFDIRDNGFSGKIVHFEQVRRDWLNASSTLWKSPEELQPFLDFCGHRSDGRENQRKIMSESLWQKKFPAFAWCASLGEGWYFPASDEMCRIIRHCDKINRTISIFNWSECCLHNDIRRYRDSTYSPRRSPGNILPAPDDYCLDPQIHCDHIRAAALFSHAELLADSEDEALFRHGKLR